MTQQLVKLNCPACGRFLAVIDGSYVQVPPCKQCGWQTTLKRVKPVDTPPVPDLGLGQSE